MAGGARRVDQLESASVALELDVTDPESSASFVTSAVDRLGGLDILVNNAGLALGRDPFDESTEEDEEVLLETNVHGLLRMTRLCLPHLGDGGHIVNIGSIAGRQAYENASLYVTSKFAVRGFTYALREDLLGPADPDHDRRSRPGGDRLLARPLPRRRREGASRLRGRRGADARRHRRIASSSRVTRPGARERRRDRGQGARASSGGPGSCATDG